MGIFALNPAHPQPRARKTMGKIQKDFKFLPTIFPPFSIFGKFQMLYKPPEKKKPLTPFPGRFGSTKKGYAPYDGKQYGFPSGTLKSFPIGNGPAPWLSTNLEMIQKL